jgi:hypothetical protein
VVLTAAAKPIQTAFPICPVKAPSVKLLILFLAIRTRARSRNQTSQAIEAASRRVMKVSCTISIRRHRRQEPKETYNLHSSAGAQVGQQSGDSAQSGEASGDGIDDKTTSEAFYDDATGSSSWDLPKQGRIDIVSDRWVSAVLTRRQLETGNTDTSVEDPVIRQRRVMEVSSKCKHTPS